MSKSWAVSLRNVCNETDPKFEIVGDKGDGVEGSRNADEFG